MSKPSSVHLEDIELGPVLEAVVTPHDFPQHCVVKLSVLTDYATVARVFEHFAEVAERREEFIRTCVEEDAHEL